MRATRAAQAGAWCSTDPHEIRAVKMAMRKGEHEAEKRSSEKGLDLNVPEVLGFAQEPGGQVSRWLS